MWQLGPRRRFAKPVCVSTREFKSFFLFAKRKNLGNLQGAKLFEISKTSKMSLQKRKGYYDERKRRNISPPASDRILMKLLGIGVIITGLALAAQITDFWSGFGVGSISSLAGTRLILKG